MNIKHMLGTAGHVVASGARGLAQDLTNTGPDTPPPYLQPMAAQTTADIQAATPAAPPEFQLPTLDDSLTPAAQKKKAEFEKANPGAQYKPGDDDYNDSGPYGYTHKKQIHDALMEYEKTLKTDPQVDYAAIARQRMAEEAGRPPEHKNNPLLMFAMGMGNPEHAQELVKAYQSNNEQANKEDLTKWQEMLAMKHDALKGAVQQAMAQGDARKVISSKWLDMMMENAKNGAALKGELAKLDVKGNGRLDALNLRGQWAVKAVQARAAAILDAAGVRANSEDRRAVLDSATRRVNTRISKGQDPESAYSDVMDEIHAEYDHLVPETHGGPVKVVPPPATGGAAAPADENPLERAARLRREAKSKQ